MSFLLIGMLIYNQMLYLEIVRNEKGTDYKILIAWFTYDFGLFLRFFFSIRIIY